MFNCLIFNCTNKCKTLHDLKIHILTHHSEEFTKTMYSRKSTKVNKTWQCPVEICKCGYMTKSKLRIHIFDKHSSEIYKYQHLVEQTRKTKKNISKNNNNKPIEMTTICVNKSIEMTTNHVIKSIKPTTNHVIKLNDLMIDNLLRSFIGDSDI